MSGRLAEREALLVRLEATGYLTDPRLEEAMLSVPRHAFLPDEAQPHAYEDRPLPVGHGQTISAPHMVALMTSQLQLEPNHRVLEIGTGMGYHAAVLSRMVPDGEVVTIEMVPELAQRAQANLDRVGAKVRVLNRDGFQGAPEFGPFDAILITCAVPTVPPHLIRQLREGGHMVVPVGVTQCELRLGRVVEGDMQWDDLGECLFVNAQGELGGDPFRPTP